MPRKPDPSCELSVKVTPRSSRNRVEATADGLNVWTSAPPTDGQANAAVCELVAKAAGVPKSAVEVIAGHTARKKRLRIVGVEKEEVFKRLGI